MEEVIQTQADLKLNLEKQDPLKSFCQDNLYIDQCQLYDNWDSWQLQMFNSLLILHDSVILELSCTSLFFFLLFFCIWFTMNQAMMSDCTITCCEIYVLWCCFRSVHWTVSYRVLGWIKDRRKGLTRSNKEHRASFFLVWEREREREREIGNLNLDLLEFVIFLWVKFVFICEVIN